MRPWLLRPPVEFCPSVSDFTGGPLWRVERSTITSWRWPGVTGLYVFNAIATLSLQSRGHVDPVTLFESHDRALHVRLLPDPVAEHSPLARPREGVDAFDFDIEQLLNRFLDLRLGGVFSHLEHDFVVLGRHGRLFGNHRGNDYVVVTRIAGGHLNRASSASSAALVNTKVLRRRMS